MSLSCSYSVALRVMKPRGMLTERLQRTWSLGNSGKDNELPPTYFINLHEIVQISILLIVFHETEVLETANEKLGREGTEIIQQNTLSQVKCICDTLHVTIFPSWWFKINMWRSPIVKKAVSLSLKLSHCLMHHSYGTLNLEDMTERDEQIIFKVPSSLNTLLF